MANLHSSFLEFYNALQIVKTKRDKIIKSHNNLRELIKKEFSEKHPEYTVGFWIQGSWKMGTTIRTKDDECDLDDGFYITPEPPSSSTTVKNWVKEAVDDVTDAGSSNKNKCIRVHYAGNYHIDIPVYVKSSFDNRWEHPKLATRDDGYVLSDPKELCDWFAGKKKNNNQLVRVISYMKAWSDDVAHTMPSGLALTILAAENQVKDERDDIAFLKTLTAIRDKLNILFACRVPATPRDNVLADLVDRKDQIIADFDRIISYGEKAIAEKNMQKASKQWIHALGERFPEAEDKEDPEMRLNELRSVSKVVLANEAKTDKRGYIQSQSGIQNPSHKFFGER